MNWFFCHPKITLYKYLKLDSKKIVFHFSPLNIVFVQNDPSVEFINIYKSLMRQWRDLIKGASFKVLNVNSIT